MAKPQNVDDYIAQFEGNFAEAILRELRSIAHEAVPQLEEKLKWGAPSFEYQGRMFGIVGFQKP